MVKRYLLLFGLLLSTFTPLQMVKAESVSKEETGMSHQRILLETLCFQL